MRPSLVVATLQAEDPGVEVTIVRSDGLDALRIRSHVPPAPSLPPWDLAACPWTLERTNAPDRERCQGVSKAKQSKRRPGEALGS